MNLLKFITVENASLHNVRDDSFQKEEAEPPLYAIPWSFGHLILFHK